MRTPGIGLAAMAAAAIVLAAAVGCHEESPAGTDAGDADVPDARIVDARAPDAMVDAGHDASPDASVDGQVIQHDFCNDPFFKLPIDGQTERTVGIEIDGSRVLWTKESNYPQQSEIGEIYLLDLESCIERQLTVGSNAGRVHLSGDAVVWDEFADSNGPFCTDLYHLDLATEVKARLTQTPGCELEPRTNGRHVAYLWYDTIQGPTTVPPQLRVLDLETGDDTQIWSGRLDSFDLDARYVVWPGYGQDPQSVGRDLYVHDLATGVTRHLDFTYERYQWWVYLWQGWVTIRGTDDGLYDPLNFLQLYHLETEELRSLIEGDHATSAAWIGEGLLGYNTSQYSVQPALNPSDVEVYEISSGMSRRITLTQSNVRVQGVRPPHLLLMDRLFNPINPSMNDFYIANLEALGVLDASGNLIPGGPVLTPP